MSRRLVAVLLVLVGAGLLVAAAAVAFGLAAALTTGGVAALLGGLLGIDVDARRERRARR